MKFLFYLIVLMSFSSQMVIGYNQFSCYAPPLVFGNWCKSGEGIFGKKNLTIDFTPLTDTQIFCELNCCGKIIDATIDYQSCLWDCSGVPAIRCYGIPNGSGVNAFQN